MYLPSLKLILILSASYSISKSLYNAALYKPVWESSLYFPAYLGNDGKRPSRNSTNFLCAHTSEDDPAWWMVDLKGQFVIEQLIFTNRDDDPGAALWIRNFQIDVFTADPRKQTNFLNISGDVCFRRTDPLSTGTYVWNCTTPVIGRFVRFIRYTKEFMTVCELEVMVSRALERFHKFTRFRDTMLNIPLTASVPMLTENDCVQRCVAFIGTSRCTAINFNISANLCQMLSTDIRLLDITYSHFKLTKDVYFYMEVQ